MIRQWLFLIILFVPFCSEAYAERNRELLAQTDNDLWIVSTDGKPIQRLTFDGALKTAATWSPDGNFIACCPNTPQGQEKAIMIMDNAGRQITKIIVDKGPTSESSGPFRSLGVMLIFTSTSQFYITNKSTCL
jgi:Tol biopolymer transport system component